MVFFISIPFAHAAALAPKHTATTTVTVVNGTKSQLTATASANQLFQYRFPAPPTSDILTQ